MKVKMDNYEANNGRQLTEQQERASKILICPLCKKENDSFWFKAKKIIEGYIRFDKIGNIEYDEEYSLQDNQETEVYCNECEKVIFSGDYYYIDEFIDEKCCKKEEEQINEEQEAKADLIRKYGQ